jgi:PAC2 family
MTQRNGLPFSVDGSLPELSNPVLIVQFSGWIDASGAAASAMELISAESSSKRFLSFDADTFIDYRARRPTMELRNGVNTNIEWSLPEMRTGKDANGRDVVLLTGPEPDTAWNFFADTVGEVAQQLHVSKMIGLGAYPFAAPHTRPVGITATSADPAVIERLDLSRSTLDAPAGVQSVLEHVLHRRGIEALSMWAQVPHYVASMAYPLASAALVQALCADTGLTFDSSRLRRESAVQRERLDQLVANNPEHATMLSQLENAYDELHGPPIDDAEPDIPTVDELAAEVEQFLRDQQPGA